MEEKNTGKIRDHTFICTLIVTVCVCLLITLYCVVNGPSMSASHMEPHYGLQSGQIFVAVIVLIVLLLNGDTRRLAHWYSIPAVLVFFSFVYVAVVNQYPCCSGG